MSIFSLVGTPKPINSSISSFLFAPLPAWFRVHVALFHLLFLDHIFHSLLPAFSSSSLLQPSPWEKPHHCLPCVNQGDGPRCFWRITLLGADFWVGEIPTILPTKFKIFHSTSACMVSGEKSDVIHVFFSGFFQDILFVFNFLQSEYDRPWCLFFGVYPPPVLWDPWICGLVSVTNLGKSSAIIPSDISSVPCPFLPGGSITHMSYLIQLSQSFWILHVVFSDLLLAFWFCEFPLICLQPLTLSSVSFLLLWAHPFFVPVTEFLIPGISFWFFLSVSIFLLRLPILACCLFPQN